MVNFFRNTQKTVAITGLAGNISQSIIQFYKKNYEDGLQILVFTILQLIFAIMVAYEVKLNNKHPYYSNYHQIPHYPNYIDTNTNNSSNSTTKDNEYNI